MAFEWTKPVGEGYTCYAYLQPRTPGGVNVAETVVVGRGPRVTWNVLGLKPGTDYEFIVTLSKPGQELGQARMDVATDDPRKLTQLEKIAGT